MKTLKTTQRTLITTGVAAFAVAGGAAHNAANASQVLLNGQPLSTKVAPLQRNGRTLVPMRDIFQALGATVNWNRLTQGIIAKRGDTTVNLQINNPNAVVNNKNVRLEQPAMLVDGNTMVPLRFVSEAMGATVNYNGALQLVSINTGGNTTSGTAVAGARTISVPRGVVVPVTLDEALSSATATVGQIFTASVRTQNPGDSEFPPGTRIEGVVSQVERKQGDNPGVLGLDFRAAVLPDGQRLPLQASLTSMDNDSVSATPGRITAKGSSGGGKDSLKVIGIGAGAGFLLGKLIKKNTTITALLGAAGAYLYNQSKDKDKTREAMLAQGTELGVRLDNSLTYADNSDYSRQRSAFVQLPN